MQAVIEHCAQGLALLESIDPARFDVTTTAAWATGVEQLRRQAPGVRTILAVGAEGLVSERRAAGFGVLSADEMAHAGCPGTAPTTAVEGPVARRSARDGGSPRLATVARHAHPPNRPWPRSLGRATRAGRGGNRS